MVTRLIKRAAREMRLLLILSFVVIASGGGGAPKEPVLKEPVPAQKPSPSPDAPPLSTSLTTDPLRNLLVISTLDGTLTALDRLSGETLWISHDKPMIQVPLTNPPPTPSSSSSTSNHSKLPKTPYFLPDPKTGSLYMMGKQNSLRKLPYTIPQLVARAPCRNADGLMYTGKKQDMWLALNPFTGEKHEMPMEGSHDTCPKWSATTSTPHHACGLDDDTKKQSYIKPVLIGKTEYTLSMMDGPRKWNVTYHHYSSNDMASLEEYDQVHFTSPSEGHLMTYDRSGELLWQVELTSPVVGLYSIEQHSANLVSVPFNPMASDTLERLKDGETSSNRKQLSPTTYVGECPYGLYAVPALADEHVLLIGEGSQFPRLIEGPHGENFGGSRVAGDQAGDYLLLGYYQAGEGSGSGAGLKPQIEGDALPPAQGEVGLGPAAGADEEQLFNESKVIPPSPAVGVPETTPNIPPFPAASSSGPPKKRIDTKEIKIVVSTALISILVTSSVLGVLFFLYRRHKNNQLQEQQRLLSSDHHHSTGSLQQTSGDKLSSGSGGARSINYVIEPNGELTVGKITVFQNSVLGKGCEGTFVFKGKFEGRDVAVKRILPECFSLADREVDLLKESDQHVNVIRYFCTETDGQFRYIALELCVATLSDWVEGRWKIGEGEGKGLQIDPVAVLKEATEGLGYLHSLRIVHRDVKPANVLLSLGAGKVRTMISDFGLCKKIRDGRGSYSRRSGGVPGTEGWIAPEVVSGLGGPSNTSTSGNNSRMTYSVDIFSMGCVYYFVLSQGKHPFGEAFRRQSNIITGEYDLSEIADNSRGAYNLVRAMISTEAGDRPPLRAILTHPFFWSGDKVLTYFLDVSDRIEKETEESFPLLRKLESQAYDIVKGDWRDHICSHVAMDLRKYRTYKGDNLRDLLRALRNKKNHYRELTKEAQDSLGVIPDGFVSYWVARFPCLLEYVWVIFEGAKRDPVFSRYYEPDFDWGDGDQVDLIGDKGCFEGKGGGGGEEIPSKKQLGKDFWRSKSQAKYQRWRNTQRGGGGGAREKNSPQKVTREGTGVAGGDTPSNDNNWRKRSPSNKENIIQE